MNLSIFNIVPVGRQISTKEIISVADIQNLRLHYADDRQK